MAPCKVNIKWGKQQFPDVVIDTASPVELFKAQLFALTGVPPERQKIMGVKGGAMKDNANCALNMPLAAAHSSRHLSAPRPLLVGSGGAWHHAGP